MRVRTVTSPMPRSLLDPIAARLAALEGRTASGPVRLRGGYIIYCGGGSLSLRRRARKGAKDRRLYRRSVIC